MKSKWLLAAALIIFSCKAQKNTSTAPKDSFPPVENALLWQVSGNGLTSPSYIYGTIHMICKEDFMFSSTLKEKFAASKSLYLEIDMDDPSMMMKMAMLSIMKDHTLKDIMNASDYNELSAYVKDSLGMPMIMFNRLKPMTLMSLLYTKVLSCPSESYEQRLMEMSKQQKKEINGLEKIEDQMAVFDKIPDSVEAQMILEMIRKMPEQRVQFAEMVTSYKSENLSKLGEEINNSEEWKGYEDIMLVNRNQQWIPVMSAAMKTGSQLFAVGAGHLPGKDGVITLLRKAGYKVEPIKQAFGETVFNPDPKIVIENKAQTQK
jgi:uncharacterized protein YbaP (TraB family)